MKCTYAYIHTHKIQIRIDIDIDTCTWYMVHGMAKGRWQMAHGKWYRYTSTFSLYIECTVAFNWVLVFPESGPPGPKFEIYLWALKNLSFYIKHYLL